MIGISEEAVVAKVAAEQAELPEVIGDIFADVGDGAVGADDDFGVFVKSVLRTVLVLGFCGCACAGHDPAAFVLAFVLEIEHAGFFELFEGGFPEFEVKDFALARQKIVLDAEAQHGFKMAAQDGGRDEFGDFGRFVAALLRAGGACRAGFFFARTCSSAVPSLYHCEVRA